jgi:uncharacterized membrane protein YphA (DoxX/SURF4 family)
MPSVGRKLLCEAHASISVPSIEKYSSDKAHFPRSFFPAVNGGDAAVLYCFVFLYLLFAGGGPWSVDRVALKQN